MRMYQNLFHNRRISVITKHGKEHVLRPLLEEAFEGEVCVFDAFDTDLLGTFSGEIERRPDPLTTIREKCRIASRYLNDDIIIASEGSFGPHPFLFFIPADEELLMVYDKKNEIEIVVKELSTETNFNGKTIKSIEELKAFAEHTFFPSHRLIIRDKEKSTDYLKKGIGDYTTLEQTFVECLKINGSVFVETDMRAMFNPSRMKVIESCAHKLIEKMRSTCPVCQFPGFSITEAISGLPCSLCASPTKSTLKYLSVCAKCKFSEEKIYPHDKMMEDPTYCDNCNP